MHDDAAELGGLGRQALDPRGPSLWMGSRGSATQAHYDVADNVLVQLYGSKRVRCFHPAAACALHVFPDAHPRARKSQVDFDEPDHRRFPHLASLPAPVLDVVLQPGDALWIPAFWFHHLENCWWPTIDEASMCSGGDATTGQDCGVDAPAAASVSLNIFALSQPMLLAQKVFQRERRPLGPGPLVAAAVTRPTDDEEQQDLSRQVAVEALHVPSIVAPVPVLVLAMAPSREAFTLTPTLAGDGI